MASKNKKSSNSPGDPENRDEPTHDEPVVRDKRRIDPETGEVRHPESENVASSEGAAPAAADEDSFTEEDLAFLTDLAAEADLTVAVPESDLAAERLADLQRLQAEYVNYRKRVERDRETARDNAIAEVVKSLLPILDDLDRAHAHEAALALLERQGGDPVLRARLRTSMPRLPPSRSDSGRWRCSSPTPASPTTAGCCG